MSDLFKEHQANLNEILMNELQHEKYALSMKKLHIAKNIESAADSVKDVFDIFSNTPLDPALKIINYNIQEKVEFHKNITEQEACKKLSKALELSVPKIEKYLGNVPQQDKANAYFAAADIINRLQAVELTNNMQERIQILKQDFRNQAVAQGFQSVLNEIEQSNVYVQKQTGEILSILMEHKEPSSAANEETIQELQAMGVDIGRISEMTDETKKICLQSMLANEQTLTELKQFKEIRKTIKANQLEEKNYTLIQDTLDFTSALGVLFGANSTLTTLSSVGSACIKAHRAASKLFSKNAVNFFTLAGSVANIGVAAVTLFNILGGSDHTDEVLESLQAVSKQISSLQQEMRQHVKHLDIKIDIIGKKIDNLFDNMKICFEALESILDWQLNKILKPSFYTIKKIENNLEFLQSIVIELQHINRMSEFKDICAPALAARKEVCKLPLIQFQETMTSLFTWATKHAKESDMTGELYATSHVNFSNQDEILQRMTKLFANIDYNNASSRLGSLAVYARLLNSPINNSDKILNVNVWFHAAYNYLVLSEINNKKYHYEYDRNDAFLNGIMAAANDMLVFIQALKDHTIFRDKLINNYCNAFSNLVAKTQSAMQSYQAGVAETNKQRMSHPDKLYATGNTERVIEITKLLHKVCSRCSTSGIIRARQTKMYRLIQRVGQLRAQGVSQEQIVAEIQSGVHEARINRLNGSINEIHMYDVAAEILHSLSSGFGCKATYHAYKKKAPYGNMYFFAGSIGCDFTVSLNNIDIMKVTWENLICPPRANSCPDRYIIKFGSIYTKKITPESKLLEDEYKRPLQELLSLYSYPVRGRDNSQCIAFEKYAPGILELKNAIQAAPDFINIIPDSIIGNDSGVPVSEEINREIIKTNAHRMILIAYLYFIELTNNSIQQIQNLPKGEFLINYLRQHRKQAINMQALSQRSEKIRAVNVNNIENILNAENISENGNTNSATNSFRMRLLLDQFAQYKRKRNQYFPAMQKGFLATTSLMQTEQISRPHAI